MIIARIDQLIGNTPILRLNSVSDDNRGIHVYGKLESINPGYSVKDRSALQLLEQATRDHDLKPGATIVESSSGNMGHALAMLCAVYRYHFICVLDPKTPACNATLVKAFGGTVVLVDTPDENGSYQKRRIATARRIATERPNCFNLDQYNNPAAIEAHYLTTGPEIERDLNGKVDVLIGAASTGSHVSGVAKYLKEKIPAVHVIGVEPVGSVVFGGEYKPFLQNGTGLSFQPGNILREHIDQVIKISDRDAFAACREMARQEGLLLGGSSGSVLAAAKQYMAELDRPCNIVLILPDGGLKYLDTIYDDAWLEQHGMLAHQASLRPDEKTGEPQDPTNPAVETMQ